MVNELGNIGISGVKKFADFITAAKADSLIDYTQVTRVEPLVLIDTSVMFLPELNDIMQSLQSIFSGYYMQAVALSASIGKIEVMKHLDKFNPNRKPIDSGSSWLLATESYKHRLPTPSNNLAMEAEQDNVSVEFGRNAQDQLKALENLSVGKVLSVELTDGVNKAVIPVSIRLIASSLPTSNLVHILSLGSKDTSVKERYHAWRSGRLEFIKDLILCQDLVDAHRKNLMADKDGIYSALIKRSRGNQLSTIISGNPSVATASNMVVMAQDTADQLEIASNGRLKDFKFREKIFQDTYLMIMVVVDPEFGRVTFYHRGIPTPTELALKDLKSVNKGNGPDVAEILKAYQMGSAPSL